MARKAASSKQLDETGTKEKTATKEKAATKENTAKKTTAPKAARKTPAKRKKSSKSAANVRVKLFWGVFSQSLKRVALYEFSQKKQADKKAAELSSSGKSPHFVQKVKEPVEETA
jgi:hypothetical protein